MPSSIALQARRLLSVSAVGLLAIPAHAQTLPTSASLFEQNQDILFPAGRHSGDGQAGWSGSAGFDNHGNRDTGTQRLSTRVNLDQAFGLGEQLSFATRNSFEGLEVRSLGYRQPLPGQLLTLGASYSELEYSLGRRAKSSAGKGEASVSSVFIEANLLRGPAYDLTLLVEEQHRRFEDQAQGLLSNGSSVFRRLGLAGEWQDAWNGHNAGQLDYGHGKWHGDSPDGAPAPRYRKARLSLERYQALGSGYALQARLRGQWASDTLAPSDRFSLGGADGVRAYPDGEAAGDQGLLVSLELRKYLGRYQGFDTQAVLFADAGRVRLDKKNAAGDQHQTRHGYGIGLDVRHRDLSMNASLAWSPGRRAQIDEREARRLWLSVSGSPQAFAGLARDLGSREDFRDKGTELVLYGSLGLVPEYVDRRSASRAAPADQTRLATANGRNMSSYWRARDNVSYVGARAGLPLGERSRLLWQLEYGLSLNYTLDGDRSAPDSISPNTRLRNSAMALDDDRYGTLLYGVWDMPLKESTTTLDPFSGKTSAAYYNIIGSPGFNSSLASNVSGPLSKADDSANSDAAFNRRQSGVLAYWTPRWHGLRLKLAYSNNGMRAANDVDRGYLYGGSLSYQQRRLTLVVAAERHVNYFGIANLGRNARGVGSNTHVTAGTTSDDYSIRLGLGYRLGNTRLSLVADELHYSESRVINRSNNYTDLSSYRRRAYMLGASHHLGAWRLRASYAQALPGECSMIAAQPVSCSTHGMGARQYALGVGYRFNRHSEVFAHYVLLRNASLANYNFAVAGAYAASGHAPGVGTTINAIGTGFNYSF